MTYSLLALPFLLAAVVVLGVARRRHGVPALAVVAATTGVLLVFTLVFDNLMIAAGLFTYGEGHVLGVRLGLAPLEDLSYPLAGALLLPALWHLLGARASGSGSAPGAGPGAAR